MKIGEDWERLRVEIRVQNARELEVALSDFDMGAMVIVFVACYVGGLGAGVYGAVAGERWALLFGLFIAMIGAFVEAWSWRVVSHRMGCALYAHLRPQVAEREKGN